jgi:hypothetical protein
MKYFFITIVIIAVILIANQMINKRIVSEELPDSEKFESPKLLLMQFGDLKPDDFNQYPVWVQCHVIDYDEPWYEETDEETFRPWRGTLPVDPSEAMFLVKADLTLSDGTEFPGILTPQQPEDDEGIPDLGMIQPQLFHPSGEIFSFWFGIIEPPEAEVQRLYSALGKNSDQIFPIQCEANTELANGITSISVPGFCWYGKGDRINIKK